ncbi:MAG: redox-regulated ATPase YchF [Parachlamydiales bacterium]|jgi:hypothetical protein
MSDSNLTCGIVGLPNVGKSTLFKAITKKQVPIENYPFCTIEPNIGTVALKDPRLEELAKIYHSQKIVYATVAFIDIAGLVKGASKGEGLGNQFLSNIRQADAIIHVVRCFESDKIIHVSGSIDPVKDAEIINLELILADLQTAESMRGKLEKKAKSGDEEALLELDLIKKAIAHLNSGRKLSTLELTKEEAGKLKNGNFLSAKKMLYVANVSEKDLPSLENEHVKKLRFFAQKENSEVLAVAAKIEEEIAELNEEEAAGFLQSLGLKESGLNRLAKAAFKLLDLIAFLTAGELEARAWTIKKGTTAEEAAGKIHSDIEKGFIRAEVVSYNDMIKYNGRIGAKEAGLARSEGRHYVVRDDDVILFFHS